MKKSSTIIWVIHLCFFISLPAQIANARNHSFEPASPDGKHHEDTETDIGKSDKTIEPVNMIQPASLIGGGVGVMDDQQKPLDGAEESTD